MRIQHTKTEVFAVCFRCGRFDSGFHFHHLYSSVSGYRLAVKKLKRKYLDLIKKQRISYPLEIQVIWSPFPFCDEEDKRIAYEEVYNG